MTYLPDFDTWAVDPEEVLLHVTPIENMPSITDRGLLPTFSKTKTQRVYAVENHRVPWALLHVSAKEAVPVGALVVMVCVRGDHWKRFGNGIWYTEMRVEPIGISSPVDYIEDDEQ